MTMKGRKAGDSGHDINQSKHVPEKQKRRSGSIQKWRVDRLLSGKTAGRLVDSRGYTRIKMACHPRSSRDTGYVYEHIVAAEFCLGRFLEQEEVVHHVDGDRSNSYCKNLVVFPGQGAHMRYHIAVKTGKVEDDPKVAVLLGGIQCHRPKMVKTGPHWMRGLRNRMLGDTSDLERVNKLMDATGVPPLSAKDKEIVTI